jgi:hypothetical protein
MYRIFIKALIKCIQGLLWVLDRDHRTSESITDDYKKFTHTKHVDFDSDFARASKVFRTVPYETWIVRTASHELIAADKHLIVLENGQTEWIENLQAGDWIKTATGIEQVTLVQSMNLRVHMYDLEIDSDDHLFYTNGILSHNTTCAAIYILWRAIFQDDQTILIAGNKNDTAIEVMDRIKFIYEYLPLWLKPGVTTYNKKNVVFENNSEIITRATTKDTGRGLSISLLYCLAGGTTVRVRDKVTLEEKEISLEALYDELIGLTNPTFILGIE